MQPPSPSVLLSRWQEAFERGIDLSAEDLCRDQPGLAEQLRPLLEQRRRGKGLSADLTQPETPSRTADDLPTLAPTEKSICSPVAPTPTGEVPRPRVPDEEESLATLAPSAGDSRTAFILPTAPELEGVQVPGYEILGELGRGGMGVVYRARHTRLNRIVALKMILAGGHAGPEEHVRFLAEAEAIAAVKHPGIVQVFDFGNHAGRPFFSLEFCEGGSLAGKLVENPLPARAAASLVVQVARAMQAAHDKGIVHRDLKPANILLTEQGQPKVTDFGLAKRVEAGAGMTATGSVMGTPSYMAPEQAQGTKDVGRAADVYALGAILYDCLAGRPPFKAATVYDTLLQVVRDEPVALRQLNAKVPADLETICLKCLHKEPLRRYATAGELADDLRRWLAGEAISARPVGVLEHSWRWCRRNPVVAASLFAVALSLLAATGVSLLFGLRAEYARQAEAERALSEAAAKHEAEQSRRDAQRQVIELCAASGLTAAREGDQALALLWFARAVRLAKDDPQQEEPNRIRFANWRRNVCLPEGTFNIPGFQQVQHQFQTFEFSPDGKYLLVVASTGDCMVWDRQHARLVPLPKPAAKGLAAAWQPLSGVLAIAEKKGPIRFLAPPEFRPVGKVVPSGDISVLAFSRDGTRLAWGGTAGARVWEQAKHEYLTPLLPHGGTVDSLSFSANGKLLATSALDSRARVFRVAPDRAEPLFPPVVQRVSANRFDDSLSGGREGIVPRFADNDQVLLTGVSNRLDWRSATTGQIQRSVNAPHLGAFAVSPSGSHVAALWLGGGRLWQARSPQFFAAIPQPRITCCADVRFAADGKTLVTGDRKGTVHFWSVDERHNDTLATSSAFVAQPMQVARNTLSPDGRHLAAALWDGKICLWHMPKGPPIAYTVAGGWPTLPALSPDHHFVLPRSSSFRTATQKEVRAYEAESGKVAGPILDPGGIVIDAAFSPDGTRVASASLTAQTPQERKDRIFEPDGKAGNIQFWDWKSGQRVAGPVPLPSEPRGLAYRPDGRTLGVVCADYHVLLVDPKLGKVTRKLNPGAPSRPTDADLWWANGNARFGPDGRFLMTWGLTPAVHVWDPDRGQLLHTLLHNQRVQDICFSPTTPALLATAGRDRFARLWNVETGKLLAQLLHPHLVIRLRFSPDGMELITSCDDGNLRVWDWQTGKLKVALPLHSILLQDFDFIAHRRWLITLGAADLLVTDWRTKTAVGPLWNLKRSINLALDIPAGDRRAIVGGFSGSLVGYDLKAMVTPATAPADDLVRLAEVAAGRRILSQGNVVPLTSAEWAERWQRLRREGSPLLPRAPAAPSDH